MRAMAHDGATTRKRILRTLPPQAAKTIVEMAVLTEYLIRVVQVQRWVALMQFN
jgi:hypothetical protein